MPGSPSQIVNWTHRDLFWSHLWAKMPLFQSSLHFLASRNSSAYLGRAWASPTLASRMIDFHILYIICRTYSVCMRADNSNIFDPQTTSQHEQCGRRRREDTLALGRRRRQRFSDCPSLVTDGATNQAVCPESIQVSRRPYLTLLAAGTHDLYTVIWQCTGEVSASKTILMCKVLKLILWGKNNLQ